MELKKSDGTFIDTELTATPILNYKNEVDSFTIIGKIEPPVVVKEVVKEVEAGNPVYQSGKTSQSVKEMDENFLSSMFHEILTPINVIIGFVQELTENAQNITPEQKEAVDIINQNRTTLLNTMNSIIEFSGIEKERFDLNPQDISITEIIDYLQKDIEELSGTRGVDFAYGKISSSLRFESDKKKFQHLISLLLNISTQLTKDKKIYFSAYQQEQDSFVISIKDSYSSVSKYLLGNLKYIFEGNNIESGKDLGVSRLTIRLVKKLFGMLNGEFRILSTGDKADYGFIFPLKFSFVPKEEKILEKSHVVIDEEISPAIVYESKPEIPELPMPEKRLGFRQNVNEEFTKDKTIEKPKSKKLTDQGFQEVPSSKIIVSKYNIGEPEIEEPVKIDDEISQLAKDIKEIKPYSKSTKLDLSQMSCLYIEDQIDSQILFKVQMKEMKEIKFAVSFEEALPLLDNGHFDIIVMDINLQGEYNGLDALKIIHKMPVYEKIPIIAVTAYVLPGDKEKFIATGFNDFISKPIFREKMIDSLERIFMMQM
jgi:CheY-like chemotaxis protein